MSLEQIEQMVRAANPVPDVAILGGSVSHPGHPGAPTPDPRGGPGPILPPLNGEQFGDIDEREAYTTSPDDLAGGRHQGRRWMLVAAATIVVLGLGLAVTAVQDPDSVRTDTVAPTPAPPTNPATTSPLPGAPLLPPGLFVGVWLSTDSDGSSQTMEIERSDDGSAQMTLHDAAATALCSSAAASVTGTGARESRGDLVVTISGLSCDDGSEPRLSAPIESGYTFTYHRQSDTLTDNSGVVWRREGRCRRSKRCAPDLGRHVAAVERRRAARGPGTRRCRRPGVHVAGRSAAVLGRLVGAPPATGRRDRRTIPP